MLVCLTGVSCASLQAPLTGLLYNDTQSGLAATSSQAGNRVGEACATSILGLYATGDASIENARRNGGIAMVTSVDQAVTSYAGVYSKYCTVVRGR
jgi:hypothetical protein